MGKLILTNVRLFTVAADLTGASNKVEITTEAEDKDSTNYASQGWKEVLGGLRSAEFAGEGQWEAGDPGLVDDASWAQLGGVGPWSVGPDGAAVGDLAYFTKALRGDYKLGDQVGEIAPWESTGKSAWPLVRGQFAQAPGTPVTASGSTAGLQLGAIAAGKRLYASLHVLSVAGTAPSLTVAIESDTDNTFASPTARHGFSAFTGPGGDAVRTNGDPVTDTWWRATYTVAGTSPSFMFVLALGIA